MPQPDVRKLMVIGPLQNVSIAYKNKDYIGDRVFPIIDNSDPKAKIARYLKGAWFEDDAGIRGPGGESPRGGFPVDFINISTEEYSRAATVTQQDRRAAKSPNTPPLQPDMDAVEFAANKIDLKKERLIAAAILTATWADGNSGGEDAAGGWAAGDGNTFLEDIEHGIKTIQSNSGVTPNKLVIDLATFLNLNREATVRELFKYTSTEKHISTTLLAQLLQLDEILIGKAIYSTAKETKAGTQFTSHKIWEKNAGKGMGFLFYAPPSPGLKTPSAGYQVRTPYEGGQFREVATYYEPQKRQDVYEVSEETDIVATGLDLGYLWKDTLLT